MHNAQRRTVRRKIGSRCTDKLGKTSIMREINQAEDLITNLQPDRGAANRFDNAANVMARNRRNARPAVRVLIALIPHQFRRRDRGRMNANANLAVRRLGHRRILVNQLLRPAPGMQSNGLHKILPLQLP